MPAQPPSSKRGNSQLAANLAEVREAISDKAVKLIAVTKHASIEQIEEAFALGLNDFGESRIQDALKKRQVLPPQVAQKQTGILSDTCRAIKLSKQSATFH